jgi:hypothetical protein
MTTSDRLRADTDSGRTGGKVAVGDPAAALLGTDDEAAGTTPSRPGRGADQNPTGPGADPRAGNVGSTNTGSTDPAARPNPAVK